MVEKDPVCGMEIDASAAAGKSNFEGKTYYFCAPGCKKAFDKDPRWHIERASEPSIRQANKGSKRRARWLWRYNILLLLPRLQATV